MRVAARQGCASEGFNYTWTFPSRGEAEVQETLATRAHSTADGCAASAVRLSCSATRSRCSRSSFVRCQLLLRALPVLDGLAHRVSLFTAIFLWSEAPSTVSN